MELDTAALRLMAEDPRALEKGEALPLPAVLDPRRILYLDTETTGLSGGVGTIAFEAGLGWLDEKGFTVRQLVMRDYPEERFLLGKSLTAAGILTCCAPSTAAPSTCPCSAAAS